MFLICKLTFGHVCGPRHLRGEIWKQRVRRTWEHEMTKKAESLPFLMKRGQLGYPSKFGGCHDADVRDP